MISLATTKQTTHADQTAIFKLWADIDNWHTYDEGIEWAKLEGQFQTGARYTIKPKGGPKVKAKVLAVDGTKGFTDVSYLPGAKMIFEHRITPVADNDQVVSVDMALTGPLAFVWKKILGKNQQADLEASTRNLIATAEKV